MLFGACGLLAFLGLGGCDKGQGPGALVLDGLGTPGVALRADQAPPVPTEPPLGSRIL